VAVTVSAYVPAASELLYEKYASSAMLAPDGGAKVEVVELRIGDEHDPLPVPVNFEVRQSE